MRISRKVLLPACAALTANAYYLVMLTHWGSYYHSGGPVGSMVVNAFVVLAAYSCLEVLRTEKVITFRVIAALLGVPLALFVLFSLWYGLKPYVSA